MFGDMPGMSSGQQIADEILQFFGWRLSMMATMHPVPLGPVLSFQVFVFYGLKAFMGLHCGFCEALMYNCKGIQERLGRCALRL